MRIDVISDFVCPWCRLGALRLRKAIDGQSASGGEPAEVHWHGFFLNPDTPPCGEPYHSFMARKFGSAAAVERLHRRIEDVAAGDGIVFRFDAMRVRPSTLRPHALVDRLQAQGYDVSALVQGIFEGHFIEGRNIGLASDLEAIALAAGLPARPVRAALDHTPQRLALDRLARAVGADSVPIFVFDHRLAVTGAQSTSVLAEAIAGRHGGNG